MKCEDCKQVTTPLNLFLCKGLMRCQGCYMKETKGNTIYFDEGEYPRKKDSHKELMEGEIHDRI